MAQPLPQRILSTLFRTPRISRGALLYRFPARLTGRDEYGIAPKFCVTLADLCQKGLVRMWEEEATLWVALVPRSPEKAV